MGINLVLNFMIETIKNYNLIFKINSDVVIFKL